MFWYHCSLELTGVDSVTDAAFQKKIFESGITALIISNEEVDNIMRMVQSFEFSPLWGTFSASLLKNLLTGKAVKRQKSFNILGQRVMRAGKGTIRVGQDFQCHLILSLSLKCKRIIKMNLNFMIFTQEITCLK